MIKRFALLGMVLAVHVEAYGEGHAVAAKAGSLGLGVEYTYAINERVSVRGGLNGANFGFDSAEAGIEYEFDFIWDSISVGVDFHPRQGPLRLSAGILSNDNGMEAFSRPTTDIVIGATTYTPADIGSLRGDVEFDSTAPYVGIGWDWSRKKRRFGVSLDLGLLKQGAPQLTLSTDGILNNDPGLQADLVVEQVELEAALDDLDLLPFATLGFVFRF